MLQPIWCLVSVQPFGGYRISLITGSTKTTMSARASTTTATASTTGSDDDDVPIQSAVVAAPLYITVGPPCSGKTTWLKQQQDSTVDISLDDQPNVYIPIPTDVFAMSADKMLETKSLSSEIVSLLQTSIYGKTVQERLLSPDQQELRWVVQRMLGLLSEEQLEASLRSVHIIDDISNINPRQPQLSKIQSEEIVRAVVKSVERLIKESQATSILPETIDLFIVEALFQENPDFNEGNDQEEDNITGIERATNILRQTSRKTSVAWGNTNTKPRDYAQALEIAQQQGRPVYFCVFDSGTHGSNDAASLFQLPHVSYTELIQRNMQRLVNSGRYVPAKAIWDAAQRVKTLINDVSRQVREKNQQVPAYALTKFDLDSQLAELARFELKRPNRIVKEMKNNVRYPKNSRRYGNNQGRFPSRDGRGVSLTSWGRSGPRHGRLRPTPLDPQFHPARLAAGNNPREDSKNQYYPRTRKSEWREDDGQKSKRR